MLIFKKLFKSLTVDDLPPFTPQLNSLRRNASILIIDDKEFVYEEGLRNAQFNIEVHPRWNGIKDVEPFSVIVSDNQGVVHLRDNSDGLTMVNQARKLYPEKKFALYSGNLLDIRDRNIEDLNIRTKGDSLDAWIVMLDKLVREYSNPRNVWEKLRDNLADCELSEKEIRRLQHYFVLSVLEKTDKVGNQSWSVDKTTLSLIIRVAGIAVSAARLYISL